LDESLRRIVLGGTRAFDPDPETIVTANFFLAHYSMRQGIQDIKQLESYVDSGLAGCAIWKNEERRASWERKYSYLKQKLDALEEHRNVGPSVKAVAEDAPSGASVPRTDDPRILVEEGKEHILDIIGMSRGDGVAKIGRLVVFVPGTKVGDRVRVRIKTMGPRFAIGELAK
jgi:predicted RNA-binding protein with TRAM domain